MSAPDNLEIEVKLKIPDTQVNIIRDKINALGFQTKEAVAYENNIVFDTQDKQLKKNHHLLRLRQKDDKTILTFKRPSSQSDASTIYKIREEIETEVANFANTKTIIEGLGYTVYFIYEKYREIFSRPVDSVELMLDRTPIGYFLEIEGTEAQIDATATALGFSKTDYITANYLSLFRRDHPDGFMQF